MDLEKKKKNNLFRQKECLLFHFLFFKNNKFFLYFISIKHHFLPLFFALQKNGLCPPPGSGFSAGAMPSAFGGAVQSGEAPTQAERTKKKKNFILCRYLNLQTKRKMRFLKFFLSIFYVKSKKNKISSSS